MNNPNPFLPQGAFLEQKNKARTRLKIAVFFSISLSVVVLMALLIQGCRKPNDQTDGSNGSATDAIASNNTPQLTAPSNELGSASNAVTTNATPETNPVPVVNNTPPPPVPPALPVAETEDYTIVKNDTYATIAKGKHTTAKAIADANPGVDPKKLKIGQKIHLPAAASGSSTSGTPAATSMAADTASAGGMATYKVKSGDTLTTIAKKNHVTIKAIQSENHLTTTSIKVGQVLKIPGTAAPASAPAETMPPPVSAPTPAPAPAPATTTAPPPAH
jgi:LysM repeat protein